MIREIIYWECCGSKTETEGWAPDVCPLCSYKEDHMVLIPLALVEKLNSDNMRRSIGWRNTAVADMQEIINNARAVDT
jgi:hypothetical protein